MKTRVTISVIFLALAIGALSLPLESCREEPLFGGPPSPPTTQWLLTKYFQPDIQTDRSAILIDLLPGFVFIPAVLVFTKPRASISRIVLSLILVLSLAGIAVISVAMLTLDLWKTDVNRLPGFYLSMPLAIFPPLYALWLFGRSIFLLRRSRRHEQPIPEYSI